MADLKAGRDDLGGAIRHPGGGRKRAVETQPGLLAALEALIEDAIRGDPEAPLRWVSRSQRNIAVALRRQGFEVSQKLVGRLLRALEYSCQANRKTREGSSHPDRNTQFASINATVKTAITAGEPAILVDMIFRADVAWHRPSGNHADMACPFRRRGGLTVWVTPATIAAWTPAQCGRRNRADAAVGFRSAVAPD